MILSKDQASIVQRLLIYRGIRDLRGVYLQREINEIHELVNAIFAKKDKRAILQDMGIED